MFMAKEPAPNIFARFCPSKKPIIRAFPKGLIIPKPIPKIALNSRTVLKLSLKNAGAIPPMANKAKPKSANALYFILLPATAPVIRVDGIIKPIKSILSAYCKP
jgi:hypothetical protein